jgi:nucleoside-diphosphate-sugar epimerase
MSVLVTGTPGWLGTRLVEILREKKRRVRCLVLPHIDDTYLRQLGAEIWRGNLTQPETLKGICEGVKTVFHCAGIIHPKRIKEFYELNVNGTKNILEESIGSKVERFIYVSSNSAQGINFSRDKLMTEDDPPRPYMHYGRSKLKAEELVNSAFKKGKIKTTIIRPCWFYGPGQPERQTRFFKMIKLGRPILFGDGENLRSMSYIDNVIQGLLLAEEKEKAIGETYWIADERPYRTIEIYETIAKILGVKIKPKKLPAFSSKLAEFIDWFLQNLGIYCSEIHVAGEMTKNIACSIEKAKRELGYHPEIALEEGMRRSIEWCRQKGIEI